MSTVTQQSTPTGPDGTEISAESPSATLRTVMNDYAAKIRGGDVGSFPAVLGLLVLVITFSILRPQSFTNAYNFANLINQSASVIVLAMGLVFVLLLGEIDLSAGFAGGVAAAVMGTVMTEQGWGTIPSILACVGTGAVIGLGIGLLVAKLGIPSFVVTLAAFLGFQGVIIRIVGEGGTIGYENQFVLDLNNGTLPVAVGWILAVAGLAGYGLVTYARNERRRRRGLTHQPMLLWGIKTAALVVVVVAAVAYLSTERSRNIRFSSLKGVPIALLVIAILVVGLTFLLSSTPWGRHVYAVGGNAEGARRAGINVFWVKLSCFIMCSSLAALAGMLIASRDNGVTGDTGGGQFLLYAVGAAVIGGTSLFGGKGRVVDAVIGGLVIAVIDNGMLLLKQPPSTVYIVTGLVLLLAASVDAISRQRSAATGRA